MFKWFKSKKKVEAEDNAPGLSPWSIPGPYNETIDTALLRQKLEEIRKKHERIKNILETLDLPVSGFPPSVDGTALVDIFMDDKKMKRLLSKLRMKAFW